MLFAISDTAVSSICSTAILVAFMAYIAYTNMDRKS